MDDIYAEAGMRIRELRELRHYSREQFAELTEISPKFLYEIETGKKGFSAYTLLKMSEVLEIPTDYIMMGGCEDTRAEEINLLIGRFNPKHMTNVEKLLAIVYEMSRSN